MFAVVQWQSSYGCSRREAVSPADRPGSPRLVATTIVAAESAGSGTCRRVLVRLKNVPVHCIPDLHSASWDANHLADRRTPHQRRKNLVFVRLVEDFQLLVVERCIAFGEE